MDLSYELWVYRSRLQQIADAAPRRGPSMSQPTVDRERAVQASRELLVAMGYDIDGHLARTADRVVDFAASEWAASGAQPRIDEGARLPAGGAGPVVLTRIPVRSVCEHHLLPFVGSVDVVFRPRRWIIGIGRIVEIVDLAARRLQLQERLVEDIADAVHDGLAAEGTFVLARATHSCLWARGVAREDSVLVTTAARGSFAAKGGVAEALALTAAAGAGDPAEG